MCLFPVCSDAVHCHKPHDKTLQHNSVVSTQHAACMDLGCTGLEETQAYRSVHSNILQLYQHAACRWYLASGPAVLSTQSVAKLSLQLLHDMVGLLPATEVDEDGGVIIVQPLPKTHLALTSPTCLPRLSQVGNSDWFHEKRLCANIDSS
jgi:hypothetical protein